MRRASITISDGLESALEKYRGDLEVPPSLASVVQVALEEYLEGRGYPVEDGLPSKGEIILPSGPKPRENLVSDAVIEDRR